MSTLLTFNKMANICQIRQVNLMSLLNWDLIKDFNMQPFSLLGWRALGNPLKERIYNAYHLILSPYWHNTTRNRSYDRSDRMPLDLFGREKRNLIGKWNSASLVFKITRNIEIADSFLTATSKSSSPLVPWSIFTRFPILFSQMYRACCRAEPATIYSPSPEKQHFFHGVLHVKTTSQVKQLNNST